MSHVPATTTFNAEDKAIVTRESTTMREWVNKMPLDDLHKLNNLYFREKLLQQKNFRLQSTIENLEQKSLTAFSTNISVPEALIGSCIAGPHIYIIGKLICYSAWNTYFMFRTNQQHRAEKNLHRTQKTIQDLEQKLSSIMKERPQ